MVEVCSVDYKGEVILVSRNLVILKGVIKRCLGREPYFRQQHPGRIPREASTLGFARKVNMSEIDLGKEGIKDGRHSMS